MYLDPGFGGMLIQIIVFTIAAGGALVFMLRKKISSLFKKNKQNKEQDVKDAPAQISDGDVIDALSEEDPQ